MGAELRTVDVYARLRQAIEASGSQATFAAKVGVSECYISLVVNAAKPISKRLLDEIGVKREVKFVEVSS